MKQHTPLLYTDTLNGRQACRDDLWVLSTKELMEIYAKEGILLAALQSIAGNTCCSPCQEAKLVATKALINHEGK